MEEKEREAWRVKLLSATGQKGKFSEFYDLWEKLGEGLEGEVRRAVHKQTKLVVAAKVMKRATRDPQFELQLEIGKRLKHKGLVQLS